MVRWQPTPNEWATLKQCMLTCDIMQSKGLLKCEWALREPVIRVIWGLPFPFSKSVMQIRKAKVRSELLAFILDMAHRFRLALDGYLFYFLCSQQIPPSTQVRWRWMEENLLPSHCILTAGLSINMKARQLAFSEGTASNGHLYISTARFYFYPIFPNSGY